MDSTKKISFGFNKLNRKTNILINKEPAKEENSKVQLIEYLEEQSIKVIGDENNVPAGPLIIPMKTPNKKLINLVDIVKNDFKDTVEDNQEKIVDKADAHKDEKALTLDELAARELMNGLTKDNSKNDVTKVIEVPGTEKVTFEGEKESSLDDYESIPVEQFGKAMLRGMGWKDGQGIGKNQQLVKVAQPVIRPKGMGLGADSVTKKGADTPAAVDRNGKVLTCVKGAHVKVIAGYHKGYYGQILGFDDESGRFIIKLTLTNINVSLNEFLVTPVTKEDYNKNSKVLNNAKYEEFLKNKELKENSVQHGGEKQIKQEPEDSSHSTGRNHTKVSVKKEQNYSSNDEKKDYAKVEIKKEKNSEDEDRRRREQRSRSHEEHTRKHRENKYKSDKSKVRTKDNTTKERKNDHAKRYTNSENEEEDNKKEMYDANDEYSANKSTSKKYSDKRKVKKANRKDKYKEQSDSEYESNRRMYSSRERKRDSDSGDSEEDNKKSKKRGDNSAESNERKSRKHSRNKRYNASDSESEDKYERKSHKKDKYRDRSKHSSKDKRR